jgi:hypothetical protein
MKMYGYSNHRLSKTTECKLDPKSEVVTKINTNEYGILYTYKIINGYGNGGASGSPLWVFYENKARLGGICVGGSPGDVSFVGLADVLMSINNLSKFNTIQDE